MRYEADLTNVVAGFAILEKGEYELAIGEPKSFERPNRAGVLTYGVRYPLVVAEGPEKGSKVMFTVYTHTPDGMSFGKPFVMAALGYKSGDRNVEKQFDAKFKGSDWGFDTESGATGDMWREVTGKRVMATVDVSLSKEDGITQQQQWKGFRPLQ